MGDMLARLQGDISPHTLIKCDWKRSAIRRNLSFEFFDFDDFRKYDSFTQVHILFLRGRFQSQFNF